MHFDAKLEDARQTYYKRMANPQNEQDRAYRGAINENYGLSDGDDAGLRQAIWEGKDGVNNGAPLISGPHHNAEGNPCTNDVNVCPGPKITGARIKTGSSVWHSMIGFDLIQSLGSLPGMAWTKRLPGGIGDQATFYTFQTLTTYQNNNRPSGINAVTNAPRDRHQRWEQLHTFGTSGFYFRGKLEPLFAVGYSVNDKQPVILAQTYWHDWLIRNLDLFVGAAIYPGSINDTDASYYADRDTVWFRLQYYLLSSSPGGAKDFSPLPPPDPTGGLARGRPFSFGCIECRIAVLSFGCGAAGKGRHRGLPLHPPMSPTDRPDNGRLTNATPCRPPPPRGCPYTLEVLIGREFSYGNIRSSVGYRVGRGRRKAGDRDRTGDLVLGKHTL